VSRKKGFFIVWAPAKKKPVNLWKLENGRPISLKQVAAPTVEHCHNRVEDFLLAETIQLLSEVTHTGSTNYDPVAVVPKWLVPEDIIEDLGKRGVFFRGPWRHDQSRSSER